MEGEAAAVLVSEHRWWWLGTGGGWAGPSRAVPAPVWVQECTEGSPSPTCGNAAGGSWVHRSSVQTDFIFSLPASLTSLIIHAGRSATDNLMLWQIATIWHTVSGADWRTRVGRLRAVSPRSAGARAEPAAPKGLRGARPGPRRSPGSKHGRLSLSRRPAARGRGRARLRRARSTQRGRAAARSSAEVGAGLRAGRERLLGLLLAPQLPAALRKPPGPFRGVRCCRAGRNLSPLASQLEEPEHCVPRPGCGRIASGSRGCKKREVLVLMFFGVLLFGFFFA